jgi:mannose/fructose/N-acetylgalactosamine-specific phosphotransferase system component IID
MYLILIAWLYVALLMAVAEGMSTQGTWLGALVTFVLYGLLPMGIVAYIMGTPLRRKARLQQEADPHKPD